MHLMFKSGFTRQHTLSAPTFILVFTSAKKGKQKARR